MDYKIIVDSCCDMTPVFKKKLDVTSVPLTMRLGEKEYPDDSTLDLGAFMIDMKNCKQKVGSAAPAPDLYKQAIMAQENSFVVTLSSKLSGSYASAMAGKSAAEEEGTVNTHVFDSKSASAGEVLVTMKIRELIEKKFPMEHIISTVNDFINNMKTYFVLENYDNLQKNGRLGRITGKLIKVLNVKLLMGSDGNGDIALYAKPRGVKQMIDQVLSFIGKSERQIQGENLVISHCNNSELATDLMKEIKKHFKFKEIFVIPTGGLSSLYADNKGIVLAF